MTNTEPSSSRVGGFRRILRWLAAIGFILAGANHFRAPGFYESIIPPEFPSPHLLVIISGICEIAGGIGLLVPRLRRLAGWGLIALLIAVFPANVYMVMAPQGPGAAAFGRWALWARLPLQLLFIVWVWYAAGPEISPRRRRGRGESSN